MNDGKICIPVCAETVDEMAAGIKRADKFADIIEIRFDCLSRDEFDLEVMESVDAAYRKFFEAADDGKILSTFRTFEQGGYRRITQNERKIFWNTGNETEYCDCEEDIIEDSFYWLYWTRICSFHDFSGVTANLLELYERLRATEAKVVKIAIKAGSITDAIPVWNLLDKAKQDKQSIIPIAMGEAGEWTRILGLAHGAFLTYASLDRATAPGQIAAKDMIEMYRVKELNRDTKVYAVIGDPVSRSYSPEMLNAAFIQTGENAVFIRPPVTDLDEFMKRMVRPETREVELNFGGFAVTMPHKQSIMKHLDEIDPVAEKIGAVNTISVSQDGKLTGHNTDAYGFITPLKEKFGDLSRAKVAVLGAGGAARACVYALSEAGSNVTVFVRDVDKARPLTGEFEVKLTTIENAEPKDFDILVDTTPLGMAGEWEDASLFTAERLEGVKLVYDLVTRSTDTPLIREAKIAGIAALGGLRMLVHQGARQFEIWTGKAAPKELMEKAVLDKMLR